MFSQIYAISFLVFRPLFLFLPFPPSRLVLFMKWSLAGVHHLVTFGYKLNLKKTSWCRSNKTWFGHWTCTLHSVDRLRSLNIYIFNFIAQKQINKIHYKALISKQKYMITFQRYPRQRTLDWVSFNSALSNTPSNSLDSYSKSNSKSILFFKLWKALQFTLASFDQFLLTKISFSMLSYYKQHFFKLVKIPTKEKKSLDFNFKTYNLQYSPSQKANSWKHGLMFLPPLQKTFDIFCMHFIFMKFNNSWLTTSFSNSLVLTSISKMSKLLSSSIIWTKELLTSNNGCKWW